MKRQPLIASFVLFLALCASIAYWGLQLFKPQPRPVAAPPSAAVSEPRLDAAASLFGGRKQALAVASNYTLKGVVVARNVRESVAILSTDGKPAQAVGVGLNVAPGVIVKEVHSDHVLLSEGGVTKRVPLPETVQPQVGGMTSRMPAPTLTPQQFPGAGMSNQPPPSAPPMPGPGIRLPGYPGSS